MTRERRCATNCGMVRTIHSEDASLKPPITVVLADDHAAYRENLKEMLAIDGGIEVVGQAENGKEAVRFAKQMRPDVVVMDLAMPVMGGKEATRLIVREVSQPPAVVILTMHDHARLVHELREIGASAFLTKSASLAELVAAVKEASATRPLGWAPDGAPPGSG